MLEAVNAIEGYAGRGRKAFDAEPALRDAILYQIVILGEAAKSAVAADPAIEKDLPDVEWSPISRMRDRITHHYWTTDREVVWTTATESVAELRKALVGALERLK